MLDLPATITGPVSKDPAPVDSMVRSPPTLVREPRTTLAGPLLLMFKLPLTVLSECRSIVNELAPGVATIALGTRGGKLFRMSTLPATLASTGQLTVVKN